LLLTRVITALALLPVVLGMLFWANPALWSLFALAIALVACWEWSRMCGFTPAGQGAYLLASGMVGAGAWLLYLHYLPGDFVALSLTAFILASAFWLVAAPLWLARLARPSPSVRGVAGWLLAWPAWFAFVVLRDMSPWLLLALTAMVWVADIAAYFAGKAFGKRKLAPSVSPGKTWAGLYGGMAGVAVYGAVLSCVAHAYATPISGIFAPALGIPAIVAMLVLAAVSVVGDLFESWAKRGAGLKDSSNLLPGHGGVLDRIDALTSTLPVAAFALYLARVAA
jgi:phosphatidate cytidylyltransferase